MTGTGPDADPCPDGFTLIEVVGAILLFAVALMMVIRLSGAVGEQIERSATSAQIVSLARESLDSLEVVAFESLEVGTVADTLTVRGRSFARTWTVSEYSPMLFQISVSVDPVAGGGPRFSAESWRSGSW